MSDINEFTLTRITAGGTGQQAIDKLNTPITEAETALNTLAGRISGLLNKTAVVRQNAPLSSSCYVGAMVYFNTEPGHMRYEPALAALEGTPGAEGQSVEAPSSRVAGIVITLTQGADSVHGTLLLGGCWESAAVAAGCLGGSAVAGTYYLSPYTAGKGTLDPGGHLRQPVLTYEGDGKLTVGLQYQAHDNHFHGSYVLGDHWAAIASRPSGVTAPSGAVWFYNGDTAQGFMNLNELSTRTTAVFMDGLLQDDDSFVVSQGYLWCKLTVKPAVGSVVVFNTYPFAYDSPIVRDVQSANAALTVAFRNGIVWLTQNDFETGASANSPQAVSGIEGKTLQMTPVVPHITAGPGIVADSNTDGSVILSSASLVDIPLDAYSINHNGTTMTSDGTFLYLTFPKGRASSMVISMPVTSVPSGVQMQAKVWGCCAGAGTASTFTVNAYWLPTPVAGTPVNMPASATSLGSMSFAGTNGKLIYAESSSGLQFTGTGQLVAVVSISGSPANDIRLTRIGFINSLVTA